MGPAEILADLRAIHLPPAGGGADVGWALWPWWVAGGLLLAGAALRWFRRRHWRGQARRCLKRMGDDPAVIRQWAAIGALLPRVAARLPGPRRAQLRPPAALFQPPARVGRQELADLRAFLGRLLR